MKLDADAERLLAFINSRPRVPYSEMPPDMARQALRASRAVLGGDPPPVFQVLDSTIPSGQVPLSARIYRPANLSDAGILFFHGGGWVIGDVNTHDALCRGLCNACAATVVSVDYRLAPEAKFPAAYEDAGTALAWIDANAAELGFPKDRLIVAGDSAGANLAAGLALLPRQGTQPALYMQILIYPALDQRQGQDSYTMMGSGYTLTAAAMSWFREMYLRDAADRLDVRASPLLYDSVAGVPPAIIVTAGFDPLFDEAVAYVGRLREAGVPAIELRYDGQMHGFLTMGGMLASSEQAIAAIGVAVTAPDWLREPGSGAGHP